MATISPVSSTTTAASSSDALPGSTRVPQKVLGRDDFMKLLAVQFQMQDPMKPMEDTAFIAQTAQFTSLEQTTTMANELTQLRTDQQRVVANSYLGHKVTVDLGDGKSTSGDVTAIDNSGTAPRLVVGDKSFALSAVLRVEPSVVSAPMSASQSGAKY
ncbi:flagellar hook capping FlgD N-terminal domain-containing protein [Horticoccus sp. 23ND18S-11]|uniref:flagellar hook capping FlgD N-terminal domain-containing protein n=1 Tax=Horticoccus sp. 23ND18S-11 TaxID=3391832 RepID=UPI0039C8DB71